MKLLLTNCAWLANISGSARTWTQKLINLLFQHGVLKLDVPEFYDVNEMPESDRPVHPDDCEGFEYKDTHSSTDLAGKKWTVKKDAIIAEYDRLHKGAVKHAINGGACRYERTLPIVNALLIAAGRERVTSVEMTQVTYPGTLTEAGDANTFHNSMKDAGSQKIDFRVKLPQAIRCVAEGCNQTLLGVKCGVLPGIRAKLHRIATLALSFPELEIEAKISSNEYKWDKIDSGDVFALLGKPNSKTGEATEEVATEETVAEYLENPAENEVTVKVNGGKILRAAKVAPTNIVKHIMTLSAKMELAEIVKFQSGKNKDILEKAWKEIQETVNA